MMIHIRGIDNELPQTLLVGCEFKNLNEALAFAGRLQNMLGDEWEAPSE
ncbi:hypothetical protein FDI69_gp111 [Rhodococcus phage Trina]|uniref:Uncharacterized protein n=1 Tax=Rhodococcus phage Trina TaxID=2027905 RepID=A0A2D0ZM73_9CAUD|nr:hypothetical protein FDI69_gp111 [Rhodococcus phage Trina]ASZ74925.1 hypothetical protein SEA_TRINA_111 [Rhodococcus phage Trina]